MKKTLAQLHNEYNKYLNQIQIYQGQGIALQQQIETLSYNLYTPEQIKLYRDSMQKYNVLTNKIRVSENKLSKINRQIMTYR